MDPLKDKTIPVIRIFFLLTCLFGGWLIAFTVEEWGTGTVVFVAGCLGLLVILVDVYLKGFSLRGLTALTFGLGIGALIAYVLGSSPLFDPIDDDPVLRQNLQLVRLVLFVVLMYLGAVIALRGKDEFNLVIPYIKFVPHGVDVPLVIVDTSALIDGRIREVCAAGWMGHGLVIPRFVVSELQSVADSPDVLRKARGRKGLDVLNALRAMKNLDLRIPESDVTGKTKVDDKLLFLAKSLNAKVLTTDYNMARVAELEGLTWLNINRLAAALNPEVDIGQAFEVELVRAGKEPGQAVGFLRDGSMVVVPDARALIGRKVPVEIQSVVPTSGGRMYFAEITG